MPIEVSQAQLPSLILLSVLLISIFIAIYLAGKSGDKYSQEYVERDAVNFAGVVSEADGPISTFLIVAYTILILWVLLYLFLYL